ncbi:hypothetical protein Poli38472_009001 [Pythium oligandrum]|uniref:PH domain-containing protein n=1 Tax=Pythium oligandrum TaxID=41045 RepID=A0A8K1CKP1_PYTOL|nr:hypothetical protein Poli38472_009001 [Pythium oligandrum]|eukprot:TMW64834.1 hypothetical protein Poli38472_009001 [Pythium oligandrum]
MGNVCCGGGDYEMLQRQEVLKEGNDFKKKTTYLGVLSKTESIYLQLNPTATKLQWRVTPGTAKAEEIPLSRVGKVCATGISEFMILGSNGQKLLELTAESTTVRDLWVQTLDELCSPTKSGASEDDTKALKQELAKQNEKEKDRYWKERTQEMEKRKQEAEERKKQFGNVGMKYTAQAMARR